MKRGWLVLATLGAIGVAVAASIRTRGHPQGRDGIVLELVAAGLEAPVYLTAPAGDSRLFVVEQPGRIRVIRDGRLVPLRQSPARIRQSG